MCDVRLHSYPFYPFVLEFYIWLIWSKSIHFYFVMDAYWWKCNVLEILWYAMSNEVWFCRQTTITKNEWIDLSVCQTDWPNRIQDWWTKLVWIKPYCSGVPFLLTLWELPADWSKEISYHLLNQSEKLLEELMACEILRCKIFKAVSKLVKEMNIS